MTGLARTGFLAAFSALALAAPSVAAAQATDGGAPPADVTVPIVSSLTVTPSKLKLSKLRPPTASWSLSEAATVDVTVERLRQGRRVHGICLAAKHKAPSRTACVKATSISRLTRPAPAGAARVTIAVRSGARVLPEGRYRVTVRAVDAAGNRSTPATARFTISF